MEKLKTNTEEIIAGGLLKFGRLDSQDMWLLIDGLHQKDILFQGIIADNNPIFNYVKNSGGSFTLKDGLSFDDNISSYECGEYPLRKLFSIIEGPVVKKFLSELNTKTFLLKKIQMLNGRAKTKLVKELFNDVEQDDLVELLADAMVYRKWTGSNPYDEEETFIISKSGEVELYIDENRDLINVFAESIENFGLTPKYIKDYLYTVDLLQYPSKILDVMEYIQFGNDNDICLVPNGSFPLDKK